MPTPQRQPAVEPDEQDAIGFVLRLGRALHTYGFPANRLEDAMSRASKKLGIEGQFFSTPTSIFASFGPQEDQRTFLIRVTPGEVNLGKLTALDVITRRVLRGSLAPADGSAKIDWTLDAPPTYGRALTTLAFGLASAGASRFLGRNRVYLRAASCDLVDDRKLHPPSHTKKHEACSGGYSRHFGRDETG
jgi:uncharacterized membrane protein YjjP (DUF1212 family)